MNNQAITLKNLWNTLYSIPGKSVVISLHTSDALENFMFHLITDDDNAEFFSGPVRFLSPYQEHSFRPGLEKLDIRIAVSPSLADIQLTDARWIPFLTDLLCHPGIALPRTRQLLQQQQSVGRSTRPVAPVRIYPFSTTELDKVVAIDISGPVATGKTLVAALVKRLLETEFSSKVVLAGDLQREVEHLDLDDLAQWERDMVSVTKFVLNEECVSLDSMRGKDDVVVNWYNQQYLLNIEEEDGVYRVSNSALHKDFVFEFRASPNISEERVKHVVLNTDQHRNISWDVLSIGYSPAIHQLEQDQLLGAICCLLHGHVTSKENTLEAIKSFVVDDYLASTEPKRTLYTLPVDGHGNYALYFPRLCDYKFKS